MNRINRTWFHAAGIRALKTVAQTAAASIGHDAAFSEVDWLRTCSVSLMAGLMSLLMSVAGLPEVENGGNN